MTAKHAGGRPRNYDDATQLEVVARLNAGQGRRQVALELNLPLHTVDNIRRKTGNKKPGAA